MEKKIGKKSIIALVAIAVVIIVVLAIALQPGEDLSGTLTDQSAQISVDDAIENEKVSDGAIAFDDINTKGKEIDVIFDASKADGASTIEDNLSSHIQGYARYRGTNEETNTDYDFHIFPYAHLPEYDDEKFQGYVWFVSDNEQFHIKLTPELKKDEASGCYYNHPSGLQIIGDYLVVAVIPAKGEVLSAKYMQASETYVIDLSPLKEKTPRIPSEMRIINSMDYITNIAGDKVGSLSCVGVVYFDKRYLIGYIADNTLALYSSGYATNIWETKNYTLIGRYELKHGSHNYHYQSMGLYQDKSGHVYMIGFDTRDEDDYLDHFQLTEKVNGKISLISDFNHPVLYKSEKHVTLSGGAEFKNGGGIEIYNNELYCYGSEAYAGKRDNNATINILEPK